MRRDAARRAWAATLILLFGLVANAALQHIYCPRRLPLKCPLAMLPMRVGSWVGRDEPIASEILQRAQADEYINRVYEDVSHPGHVLRLWVNFSHYGLNLRHSPEVCLPSGGWSKVESRTRVIQLKRASGVMFVSRLSYAQGDEVQDLTFWYYIFGEGPLERFSRSLPISSRSSHGRTTRGSGMTIEVFVDGSRGLDEGSIAGFVDSLLDVLEPMLPDDRGSYYIP
jgi:hypothetical protein